MAHGLARRVFWPTGLPGQPATLIRIVVLQLQYHETLLQGKLPGQLSRLYTQCHSPMLLLRSTFEGLKIASFS
jgi:hypothetical protein